MRVKANWYMHKPYRSTVHAKLQDLTPSPSFTKSSMEDHWKEDTNVSVLPSMLSLYMQGANKHTSFIYMYVRFRASKHFTPNWQSEQQNPTYSKARFLLCIDDRQKYMISSSRLLDEKSKILHSEMKCMAFWGKLGDNYYVGT